jgi:hypothetical protein
LNYPLHVLRRFVLMILGTSYPFCPKAGPSVAKTHSVDQTGWPVVSLRYHNILRVLGIMLTWKSMLVKSVTVS